MTSTYSWGDRLPGRFCGIFVETCSKMAPTGSAIHVTRKIGPVNSFRPWQTAQIVENVRWPRAA